MSTMTAEDLVRAAAARGHVLSLEVREFPEHQVPPKFYVRCSCGWQQRGQIRVRKTASEAGTRHLRSAVQGRS